MIELPRFGWVLTLEEARQIGLHRPVIAQHWRQGGGVIPPSLDALLRALAGSGSPVAPSCSDSRSDPVPRLAVTGSDDARSSWLPVSVVADDLGIGERAVRGLLKRRRLRGSQPSGDGGSWFVDPASVAQYRAERSAAAPRGRAS